MLTESTRSLTLVICTFCGAVHKSRKDAERYGCGDQPQAKYAVHDVVTATVKIGAGIEAVGQARVRVRITAMRSPHDLTAGYGSVTVEFSLDDSAVNRVGQRTNPRPKHEWIYDFEILDDDPTGNRYYFGTSTPESDIRPTPS